ncbi:MAG: rane protein [Nocardioidaceae bacterium]|nr:rane protein [Nocardioidaceae bacterium]
MSNPLDRPSRGDRRAAVRQIKDAVKAGVIVEADGDLRIQQVESAGTNADVQSQVQDLRNRVAQAPPAAVASAGTPTNPYGPVSPRIDSGSRVQLQRLATRVSKVRRRHIAPLVVGVLVAISVVNGVAHNLLNGFSASSGTAGPAATREVDMFTAGAFAELVADVRQTTGDTQVSRVVMYPSYASVQVSNPDGETLYSWRGSLDKLTASIPDTGAKTVDLAAYQPDIVFGLIDQAKKLIDEPRAWYVIVQPPFLDDEATIYAYASDSTGHGGYVSAKQDGTVVTTQTY